ncbi:phage baseplate protein [Paenibacillus sp. FSL E2-0177]|uniref:phage baseplate protein n=1 Tax=unclassified Paenibacillus TaxID=185978 RepID=UPI0030EDE0C0
MALIDGKYITVENESPSFPVTVTEQPVEKGINLIDHVQAQARTLSLTGVIVGTDAAKTRAYIIAAKDKGTIINYVGRNQFKGLITDFSTGHDYTTADGFTFTMELREIKIATSSYVETLPPPIKAQVTKIVNSGTKQTQEKKTAKTTTKKKSNNTSKKKEKEKEKEKVQKVKFKTGSKWAT